MDQSYSSEQSSQWLDEIIVKAIQSRASDIHLQPEREKLLVRFRVDGLLYTVNQLEKIYQENIISRIKVLSEIDITKHHFPQDGHFEFSSQGSNFNIRVSTIPTIYGETIVMRIFNKKNVAIKLEGLGLLPKQLEQVKKMIIGKEGIILITGPTGSGKTTMLYSVLNSLNTPEKNIITIEDPVELQVLNTRQTQINEEIGLTFPIVLRSVVRQDPDVIMLGEIRDNETAQMAIQASLIGILVLTTFHTFDVPGLITRLKEMGITTAVLAQAIKGVVSARLVRNICSQCKQKRPITEDEKKLISAQIDSSFDNQLYIGKGCHYCQNSGYHGRIGIFEVTPFDDEIRSSIIELKPTSFMYELLKKKRLASLKEVTIHKILNGETTYQEAVRVLGLIND
jgi:type II secretory ATPase GspE/PulE/Tfp pilus assembly ATPase PilB-like protein